MINIQGGFSAAENGKEEKRKKRKLALKILNKILFLLIILAGVYHFFGINDLTVKGFKLQEAKKKINFLAEENRNIKFKITTLQSYSSLSERAKKLKMVAVGDINYITTESGFVAKK